jgi:hypothetical protein
VSTPWHRFGSGTLISRAEARQAHLDQSLPIWSLRVRRGAVEVVAVLGCGSPNGVDDPAEAVGRSDDMTGTGVPRVCA